MRRVVAGFAFAIVLIRLVSPCPAQPAEQDPANEVLEHYLSERDLSSVLGAHLRKRLREGTGAERVRAAEALGKLYVKSLTDAETAEERQAAEQLATELLRFVPEADSFELRINLAKATYLTAERIAESDRVRLATADDKAEAERVLRHVIPVFDELATKINRKVDFLDKQQSTAKDDDLTSIREQLADAQKLRSLSRYYAGWSAYYLALVTNNPQKINAALENFGGLLNALPGRPAALDRVPASNLQYEHVCRAMIGCSLALSLKGDDSAIKWIEKLEASDETPPAIADKIFAYKAIVLAGAGRWSDLDVIVRRRRTPDREAEPQPLTVDEARLVSVLALEPLGQANIKSAQLRDIILRVARTGMGDLISRGQIPHVLSLVSRYGTATIGNEGFIANYVRAVQSYERAYAAHQAASPKPTKPATDAALVNQYREAAKLLEVAVNASDADKFPPDRTRASIQHGLALYYAGELEAAADALQKAALATLSPDLKRDALWYAIVALDASVESGKSSRAPERDRLAVLFIQNFPTSEEAARLLLRQSKAELLSREQTLKLLLAVPRASPVYEAARDRSAALLYAAYYDAGAADKSFAAVRFAEIAEEAISLAQPRAAAGTDKAASDAARSIIQNARRLADALLTSPTPDVSRVEAALALLDSVAAYHKIDAAQFAQEIIYRRLQIADLKKDKQEVERRLAELRAGGGQYALYAEKLMYRRASEAWRANPADTALATAVVRHGLVILGNPSTSPALVQSLRAAAADAAAAVWRADHDTAMRDRAVELDRALIDSGAKSATGLRRYAELVESKGEVKPALEAWRDLLAGLEHPLPEWYEARYHSLRLLWELDKPAAAEAMRQHKVLYPALGPEPWGRKLRELDNIIGENFSTSPDAPATPAGKSTGGSP